jgi:NAD(P)-dependent dehydrogenase (short-subunit alcohol dehydrogenase family)
MAQGKHIGKIVLRGEDSVTVSMQAARLVPDATYLITGGLGGLGLAIAEWMVEKGARHLVLVGRSAPSPDARQSIERMESRGAQIRTEAVDIASSSQLAAALDRIGTTMPPLRGVFHCAAILDDGMISSLNQARFKSVFPAKVMGAIHLHDLTRRLDLDFFTMFSSVTSVLGPPGQSNYAAANAFLDSLAHHRKAHGLPGMAINWGPWSEVGMAARSERASRIGMRGLGAISPLDGTALCEMKW